MSDENKVIELFPGKEVKSASENMKTYIDNIDRLINEGKFPKEYRVELVNLFYAIRQEAIYETRDAFIDWFKRQTADWVKALKRFEGML